MKEFFRTLFQYKDAGNLLTLTGVSGEYAGYQGVFLGEQKLYQSKAFTEVPGILQAAMDAQGAAGSIRDAKGACYFEKISGEKHLVICGGGHVAEAVVRLAVFLGFPMTVIEDRQETAQELRKYGNLQVMCEEFLEGLRTLTFHENMYCLIMTRDHAYDRQCLQYLLGQPCGYLGMLGSRKRVEALKEKLRQSGMDPALFAKLHSPVGLDIHARTPEEIAVSVMGELIAEKNATENGIVYEHALETCLSSWTEGSRDLCAVLVTIIEKHGSAPRDVGTKMLVTEAGDLVGTIGGGTLEAEAIETARRLLMKHHTDSAGGTTMRGMDVLVKEGLHCGGTVMLLFQRV